MTIGKLLIIARGHWRGLAVGLSLIMVNRGALLVLPWSTKILIDRVLIARNPTALNGLLFVFIAAFIAEVGSRYGLDQVFGRASHTEIASTRIALLRRVLYMPLSFHDRNMTGSLSVRIMDDIEGIRSLIGSTVVEFAGSVAMALLSFGILIRISGRLTVAVFSTVIITAAILVAALRVRRPYYAVLRQMYTDIVGRMMESLAGIRVVKAYAAEAREGDLFDELLTRFKNLHLQSLQAISLLGASASLVASALTVTVTFVGAHLILTHQLTVGGLVSYTAILAVLVNPLLQIVSVGSNISESIAGVDRAHELGNMPVEDLRPNGVTLRQLRGRIEFRSVKFAYPDHEDVLHDLSFVIDEGSVTALVGPSGSGKSTIIKLIAGFYAPRVGTVIIDDIDLKSLRLGEYRRQVGLVLQDEFIFDGTILENVALGNPGASSAKLIRACELAYVDKFAMSLPAGYQTRVGERGVMLSGGERQRISLARVIASDPRIFVFDEATSSLDLESESLIQRALTHVRANRTTVVVAHRLSTVRGADKIVVLDRGRIVEQGKHGDLYKRGGKYFQLYSHQERGIEWNTNHAH